MTDVKPDGASNVTEQNGSKMNGHASAAPSLANGTSSAVSPPKSPAPAAESPTPPAPTQSETPSTAAPAATQEIKTAEDPVTSGQPQTSESATPALNASLDISTTATPPAHKSGSLDGAVDESMAIDGPLDVQAPATTHKELPHHLTGDSAIPTLPPLQTDHEMTDAPNGPLSPSKIARERDPDLAEEPAAKRTKFEGEDGVPKVLRIPELPTPAAETSGPTPASGESGITKMQHKFISKSITSLKRMHDSRFFREPVDPARLNIPNYHNVITQPMDLGTIEKKLKANQYHSPQEVFDDFALMVRNSLTFNGPDHLVSQEGQKLQATFEKQMSNLPRPDEVEEKKPKKVTEKTSAGRREPRTSIGSTTAPTPTTTTATQAPKATSPQSTTFALGPEGLPVIRRDSSNPDGRPKRSIHPPKRDLPYSTKPKKKKYQWELRFCQEVLDELHKPKHQYIGLPFYYPVDPVALNIPTYHSVIKKPMDLSTVQSKLKTGQYENSKEFETDIRLMFKNCYRFNIDGDPTYLAGRSLEGLFDSKWSQKAEYLERHEPHPEQHTDSSEDESDEDAEESDEDDEKLSILQKQIAEMSRQVEMITQKKKKTPPSSKKAGKTGKSGAKKDTKKSGGGSKKDKKSKGFKTDKPRFVTYHEKQIISNGISSLPDKKMQEALRIIQTNVPALKVRSLLIFFFFRILSNHHHYRVPKRPRLSWTLTSCRTMSCCCSSSS